MSGALKRATHSIVFSIYKWVWHCVYRDFLIVPNGASFDIVRLTLPRAPLIVARRFFGALAKVILAPR